LPSDARGAPSGFGAELVREEDFYTTLGYVHDAMLWLGPPLQVYLQNLRSFWGTSLGVTVRGRGKVIPTCGLSGGGL